MPALRIFHIGRALVLMLGARALFLATAYSLRDTDITHYQVEAPVVWLVAAGVLLVVISTRARAPEPRAPATLSWLYWAACVALALALYWPALSIGLLSDDFVLLDRVAHWQIGAVTPALFRPVALFVWAVVSSLSARPATMLHALNIVLHGTNAYLCMLVVLPLVRSRAFAVLSGLLLLASPLAPESVAWSSGVFDVMATTFILLSVLGARVNDRRFDKKRLFYLLALGVAAMLSKETAAVLPLLIVCDPVTAWLAGETLRLGDRAMRTYVAAIFAMAVAFSAVRLVTAFGVTTPALSRYIVQRSLFATFGSYALPARLDSVPDALFSTPIVVGALVLLVCFFIIASTRSALAGPFWGATWAILSILPVLPILFISRDLGASRYLYLGATGWVALVGSCAATCAARSRRGRQLSTAALVVMVLCSAKLTRLHLVPWQEAAARRDVFGAALARDERLRSCKAVNISNVPDSIDGAYVLRNGIVEFAQSLGVRVTDASVNPPCAFAWDDERGEFVPQAAS